RSCRARRPPRWLAEPAPPPQPASPRRAPPRAEQPGPRVLALLEEQRHRGDEPRLQRVAQTIAELVVRLQDEVRPRPPEEADQAAVAGALLAETDALDPQHPVQRVRDRDRILEVEAVLARPAGSAESRVLELAHELMAVERELEVGAIGLGPAPRPLVLEGH